MAFTNVPTLIPNTWLKQMVQRESILNTIENPMRRQEILDRALEAYYQDRQRYAQMQRESDYRQQEINTRREEIASRERIEGERLSQQKKEQIMSMVGGLGTAGISAYGGYLAGKQKADVLEKTLSTLVNRGTVQTGQTLTQAVEPTSYTALNQISEAEYIPGIYYEAVPSATQTAAITGTTESSIVPAFLKTAQGASAGIAGISRAGIGLLTGEEPKKALVHGATSAAGAYAGSAIGTAIGASIPIPGLNIILAAVGSVVGDFFGGLFDDCIIITAATNRDSEEVKIARKFRDDFLDTETLRGYYYIGERIVPLMKMSNEFKYLIKNNLVNDLISFGKSIYNNIPVSNETISTTLSFLFLCKQIGSSLPSYKRVTGEVI